MSPLDKRGLCPISSDEGSAMADSYSVVDNSEDYFLHRRSQLV